MRVKVSGRLDTTMACSEISTHVQLLALQDVSVTSSTLSRPGRDGSVKGTGPDLLGQSGVQSSVLLPLGKDSLNVVGLLGLALAGGSLSGSLVSAERGGVLRGGCICMSDEISKRQEIGYRYSRETRTTVGKEWHRFR